MNNQSIAQKLNQIADLLELKDANIFEIRAYRAAARALDTSVLEIYEILERQGKEELKKIPGIGKSIANNIAELVKTGQLDKLEKLKKRIPTIQIEMLSVPGLGPKLTQKLYLLLKPKTMADLKRKLKDPKNLPKFQKVSLLQKSIDKILKGIVILKSASGRMLLSEALPLAEKIISELKKMPEIKDICYAGSLRRGKETIGDIDLVVKSQENPKSQIQNKIIKQFIVIVKPKQILAQGENKATVINENGAQIDLEIMPQNEWGSLLHHFTGSKEHNIKMRALAEKQGLSFSEHGFRKLKNKKEKLKITTKNLKLENQIQIYCPTEEMVFKTLGLQFIPPELREGTDEIQLAIAKKIPKLVQEKDIKGDLQTHSVWSDGKNSIAELASAAKARGYEYLAITDHSAGLGVTGGISPQNYQKYFREIDRANQKTPGIRILRGIEVNIRADGSLDQDDKFLKKFEVVFGGLHSAFSQTKAVATGRIIRALQNPRLQIIAHPSGRLIDKRPEIQADWQAVFRVSRQYNKILEINGLPLRLDLKDIYARQARQAGVKILISTDAHSINQLDFMQFGVCQARRGWLEKKDIINTLPLAGLKKLFGIK